MSNFALYSSSYSRHGTGLGSVVQVATRYCYKNIDDTNTIVIGLAIKLGATPTLNTSYPFIRLYDTDASSVQLSFYFNSDFEIEVYRGLGGTLLGTSSAVFSGTDEWKYIEIKAVINDSSGSVEVKSNESTVLNLTSQDTQNTANAYLNRIYLYGVYTISSTYYDDLYIDDSDFHGDVRVLSFNPDGDGTHSDFTPSAGSNYQCVDEGVANNDTDYVSSSTLNHKDTYTFTTGSIAAVHGVQATHYVKKSDSGSRAITPICRSNGTDYSGNSKTLTTSYWSEYDIWETDPDDSSTWTQAKIEAAEFGLEVTT